MDHLGREPPPQLERQRDLRGNLFATLRLALARLAGLPLALKGSP
jgi:hypothetical protein